jgi:peroxiredoxin
MSHCHRCKNTPSIFPGGRTPVNAEEQRNYNMHIGDIDDTIVVVMSNVWKEA